MSIFKKRRAGFLSQKTGSPFYVYKNVISRTGPDWRLRTYRLSPTGVV